MVVTFGFAMTGFFISELNQRRRLLAATVVVIGVGDLAHAWGWAADTSWGALLAMLYAVQCTVDPTLVAPARLVLISPAPITRKA